ncbi:MAG: hypothetical protein FJY25_08675 [Betaproteobacteria bacterium]|nr:hypothetical protein [Betaproteobacteria bacterium]
MTQLPLSNSLSAPTINGAAAAVLRAPGFRLPDRLSLEAAGKAFMQGPDAIDALAKRFGFKAPAADMVAAQVVTGWVNAADGAVFIAPTAGWQPSSSSWYPLVGVGADLLARFIPPKPAPVKPDLPVKPVVPDTPPEVPTEKPLNDWSTARKLSEQESLDIRKGVMLLQENPALLPERAEQLGFTPPANDVVTAPVLIGWSNAATGEIFVAPSTGWTPPGTGWQVVAKIPAEDLPVKPVVPDTPPEIPTEKPVNDWSTARKLSEQESLDIRKGVMLLRENPALLPERAEQLGFTPPANDVVTAPVLIGWSNAATGEIFVAPSTGWTPPGTGWQVVAKIPAEGLLPPPKPEIAIDPPEIAIDPPEARPSPLEPPPPPVDKIRMIGHVLKAADPVEAFVQVGKLDDALDGETRIDYQWRLGDKVIEGATSLKLPMMPLLAGKDVSVKISVSDAAGIRESVIASLDAAPQAVREAAGKLMHWARMTDQAPAKDPADGADAARPTAPADLRDAFSTPDRWDIEAVDTIRFAVRASAAPAPEDDGAISAADVLAALKLSHGRSLNANPDAADSQRATCAKPFQLIAADIDGNGVVDRQDAEALLRDLTESGQMAHKQRWLFVPERAELSGVSRNAVQWQAPEQSADASAPENWIGVMLGDIDGSWRADPSAPIT